MLYLVIFFIIAFVVLVLFVVKVKVVVEYKLDGTDDQGVVSFSVLGGIYKYDINLPTDKNKDTGNDDEKKGRFGRIYDKLANIKEVHTVISKIKGYIGKKITLKAFRLEVEAGTGDAGETGVLSGLLWMLTGIAASVILNTFRKAKSLDFMIKVTPYFAEKKFVVKLYCIFDIKLVHIIVVGIKYKTSKTKKRKARMKNQRNKTVKVV